ncbi:hypothetical protein MRX96_028539 [Rhipicephalus microplus]
MYRDGEVILEVECGGNKGLLYLSRLCQGSKGPCILFRDTWLTPNEFQYVSGRETAKDWKRSIRHHGKSMKLLLAKGVLSVHPPVCDCSGCRIGSPLVSVNYPTTRCGATVCVCCVAVVVLVSCCFSFAHDFSRTSHSATLDAVLSLARLKTLRWNHFSNLFILAVLTASYLCSAKENVVV